MKYLLLVFRSTGFMMFLLLIISGCSKKAELVKGTSSSIPDGVTDSTVTYTNYIHDLLKNNCSTCHGKEGSAAQYWLNTNTYDNAVEFGQRIFETIKENSMPPPPRKPFSAEDKNLVDAWIRHGSPQ